MPLAVACYRLQPGLLGRSNSELPRSTAAKMGFEIRQHGDGDNHPPADRRAVASGCVRKNCRKTCSSKKNAVFVAKKRVYVAWLLKNWGSEQRGCYSSWRQLTQLRAEVVDAKMGSRDASMPLPLFLFHLLAY